MRAASDKSLTLVEMVIAMAITALIGLSVAGVTMVLSTAHAQTSEAYYSMQTGRTALIRVQNYLARARLVTATTNGCVVYWAKDANNDGRINITELSELRYDPQDRSLHRHSVVFPEEMDPQVSELLNVPVSLAVAANVNEARRLIESSLRHVATPVAEDVTAFQVSVYPDPPLSKLATILLTVGEDETATTIRSAVALRADKVADIAVSEGQYLLSNVHEP